MAKDNMRKASEEFRFIKPLDEGLMQALNVDPSTPRGKIVDLIKEYICRRGKRCSLCGKRKNRKELNIDRRKPKSQGGKKLRAQKLKQ
jgi:hypothetical protein